MTEKVVGYKFTSERHLERFADNRGSRLTTIDGVRYMIFNDNRQNPVYAEADSLRFVPANPDKKEKVLKES